MPKTGRARVVGLYQKDIADTGRVWACSYPLGLLSHLRNGDCYIDPAVPPTPSPTSLGGDRRIVGTKPVHPEDPTIPTPAHHRDVLCRRRARGGPRRFGARMASQRERGKQFRRTHYQKDAKLERIEPREAHRFCRSKQIFDVQQDHVTSILEDIYIYIHTLPGTNMEVKNGPVRKIMFHCKQVVNSTSM